MCIVFVLVCTTWSPLLPPSAYDAMQDILVEYEFDPSFLRSVSRRSYGLNWKPLPERERQVERIVFDSFRLWGKATGIHFRRYFSDSSTKREDSPRIRFVTRPLVQEGNLGTAQVLQTNANGGSIAFVTLDDSVCWRSRDDAESVMKYVRAPMIGGWIASLGMLSTYVLFDWCKNIILLLGLNMFLLTPILVSEHIFIRSNCHSLRWVILHEMGAWARASAR